MAATTANGRVHQRGPREAVTADIGRVGRITGRPMPKMGEIPLMENGMEDIEAFFDYEYQSPPPPAPPPARIPKTANRRGDTDADAGPYGAGNVPSSAGRRQRRPDVTAQIGIRGRKTGALIAPPSRDRPLLEMDDIDLYFTQEPVSVPPLSKKRPPQHQQPRISAASTNNPDASDSQSENEAYDEGDTQQQSAQEEDSEAEDEDEDDRENQTANYGNRGKAARLSKVSSRKSAANTTTTAASDDEEGDESHELESQHGRRVSKATSRANTSYGDGFDPTDYYDQINADDTGTAVDKTVLDDGGTQTMELEGSSYYNKSARTMYTNANSPQSPKKPSSPDKMYGSANKSKGKGQAVTRDDSDSDDDDDGATASAAPRHAKQQASISRANKTRERVPSSEAEDSTASEDDESIKVALTRRDAKGKGRQVEPEPEPESDPEGSGDSDTGGGTNQIYDNGDVDQPVYGDNDGYPEQSDDEEVEPERLEPVQEEEENSDDQEESVQLPPPLKSAKKNKEIGKRKRGRDDSGHVEDSEEEQEQEQDQDQEEGTSSKETKKKNKGKGRAESTGAPRQKRQKPEYDPEGVRRSQRDRTSPVEFWRGEQVLYRRRDSGTKAYIEKVGVHTRPKPPVKHLGISGRTAAERAKARAKTRSASAAAAPASGRSAAAGSGAGKGKKRAADADDVTDAGGNDWGEWDEETDPDGIVWDYADGKETKDRIAFTKAMMDPKPTKNHAYKFQRIFTDADFMAAGILVIPANEAKPLKPARDNTYVIVCITGAVRVLVHRTEFSIGPGGMFKIPRGNSYEITNLTDIDAFLYFFQAREITAVVDDGVDGADK